MPEIEKIHPILPIFAYRDGDRGVVYTPGRATVLPGECIGQILRHYRSEGQCQEHELADRFAQEAVQAQRLWRHKQNQAYQPECLTVYLSNQCNLACRYCYAADESRTSKISTNAPLLADEHARRAAECVAGFCHGRTKPFTLVVHGGGEPTLHGAQLRRLVEITRNTAGQHEIPWWGYIATHGVMAESKARWLAENFNQIGLSCDGPPHIQNRQRPTQKLRQTSLAVESTAAVFIATGVRFSVRATITPATIYKQTEIVDYIVHRLGCRDIRFEPVYGEHAAGRFVAEDAENFAGAFLQAQRHAQALGAELRLSGVRRDEFHGPYCNTERNVLLLTPGGTYSACFLNHDGGQAPLNIGHARMSSLDQATIDAARKTLTRLPTVCENCANIYHCSRDCPDVCMLAQPVNKWHGGFRCLLNKALTKNWLHGLLQPMQKMLEAVADGGPGGP